eukprot:6238303-Amphidinium_carterae.2
MRLEKASKQVLTEQNPRSCRVSAMRLGSGTGKTHALLEAPSAWEDEAKKETPTASMTGIYVTYNTQQPLKIDAEEAFLDQAICIRLLLRLNGCSNKQCNDVLLLVQNVELDKGMLFEFVVSQINTSHVLIGVDECAMLEDPRVTKGIASTLGELALLLKTRGKSCLVIMTALKEGLFTSISERAVWPIAPDPPSSEAQDSIIDGVLDNPTDTRKAMVKVWGGFHMRSLVTACVLLNMFEEIRLQQVLEEARPRFEITLRPAEMEALRQYMRSCVSTGVSSATANHELVLPYLSAGNAVPPTLAAFVYDGEDRCAKFEHPVQQLFESSAFAAATKQLELCGMAFDLFRALHALPVVPHDMEVYNTGAEGIEWYRDLVFPDSIPTQVSGTNLFCMERRKVKRTSEIPQLGTYYYPNASNHPLIDRAVVAERQSDDGSCLVLYQDKLNKDLPGAVKALNAAADAFKAEGWFDDKWKLLCVAHIADASAGTWSQDKFKHPYVLVRSSELDAFYTPTFAPAISFLNGCHRLSASPP